MLYVKWTPEIQQHFLRLSEAVGEHKAAARRLGVGERDYHDLRNGRRRAGGRDSEPVPRKFVALKTIEKLAAALDDPDIEDVEALSQAEWKARGEWLNPDKAQASTS
jgi:hypothetical protein